MRTLYTCIPLYRARTTPASAHRRRGRASADQVTVFSYCNEARQELTRYRALERWDDGNFASAEACHRAHLPTLVSAVPNAVAPWAQLPGVESRQVTLGALAGQLQARKLYLTRGLGVQGLDLSRVGCRQVQIGAFVEGHRKAKRAQAGHLCALCLQKHMETVAGGVLNFAVRAAGCRIRHSAQRV